MVSICNVCGLPKDICVCEKINTERRKVYVSEKHIKGPMFVTALTGIESEKDLEALLKDLKKKLACGGTLKDKEIVLQGKHKKKVVKFLLEKGYENSQIS